MKLDAFINGMNIGNIAFDSLFEIYDFKIPLNTHDIYYAIMS